MEVLEHGKVNLINKVILECVYNVKIIRGLGRDISDQSVVWYKVKLMNTWMKKEGGSEQDRKNQVEEVERIKVQYNEVIKADIA